MGSCSRTCTLPDSKTMLFQLFFNQHSFAKLDDALSATLLYANSEHSRFSKLVGICYLMRKTFVNDAWDSRNKDNAFCQRDPFVCHALCSTVYAVSREFCCYTKAKVSALKHCKLGKLYIVVMLVLSSIN